MTWIIVIIIGIFIIRPLRRLFCRCLSFLIPAAIGYFIGLLMASYAYHLSGSPLVLIIWPVIAAVGLGIQGHKWLKQLDL